MDIKTLSTIIGHVSSSTTVWPDGKKHARSIYAHSQEECERLLAEIIIEMKAAAAAEKERLKPTQKTG